MEEISGHIDPGETLYSTSVRDITVGVSHISPGQISEKRDPYVRRSVSFKVIRFLSQSDIRSTI